jgi:hypothetical protein
VWQYPAILMKCTVGGMLVKYGMKTGDQPKQPASIQESAATMHNPSAVQGNQIYQVSAPLTAISIYIRMRGYGTNNPTRTFAL